MRINTHVSIGSFSIDIVMFATRCSRYGKINKVVWSPGGSATIYAVSAVIYGHRASLVASTSKSSLTRVFLNRIERLGVDTRFVKTSSGKPGFSFITIDSRGETIVYEYTGVNRKLSETVFEEDIFSEANLVYIGSSKLSVINRFVDQAYRKGVLISIDPGLQLNASLDKLSRILSKTNTLFIAKEDFLRLTKGDTEILFKHGVDKIVVKKGLGSAILLEHGGVVATGYLKNIEKTRNVVGSSDAFNAFFNSVYMDTGDPYRALQYALTASVLKAKCELSIPCYTREELNKQLSRSIVEIDKNRDKLVSEE